MHSSPLQSPASLEVVFNIVEVPAECGRRERRRGVCTGWLDTVTERTRAGVDLEGQLEGLSLAEKDEKVTVRDIDSC